MNIKVEKNSILLNCELMLRLISSEPLKGITHKADLYQDVEQGLNKILKFKDLLNTSIYLNKEILPEFLIERWKVFIHSDDGRPEKERVAVFNSLLEQTREFVFRVIQLMIDNDDNCESEKTVKKESAGNIQTRLSLERRKLSDLMSEISSARLREGTSNEKLSILQQQLEKQREKVMWLQHDLDEAKNEDNKEKEWNSKIKDAFNNLNDITQYYESEKRKVICEWWGWMIIIILDIVVFSWWCWHFISLLLNNEYKIEGIINLIPLYVPFVCGVALMWAAIVQKNRANRLSIALTAKIFNIHYLEQLLLMVNTLAPSTNNGIVVISKSVQDVLKHYIENIGNDDIKLSHMNKIEKDELKTTPLLEIINKILDNYGNK